MYYDQRALVRGCRRRRRSRRRTVPSRSKDSSHVANIRYVNTLLVLWRVPVGNIPRADAVAITVVSFPVRTMTRTTRIQTLRTNLLSREGRRRWI